MSYTLQWLMVVAKHQIEMTRQGSWDDCTLDAVTPIRLLHLAQDLPQLLSLDWSMWEDIITSCLQNRFLPLSADTILYIGPVWGEPQPGRKLRTESFPLVTEADRGRRYSQPAAGVWAPVKQIMERGSRLMKPQVQMLISRDRLILSQHVVMRAELWGLLMMIIFSIYISELPETCGNIHFQMYTDNALIYTPAKNAQ